MYFATKLSSERFATRHSSKLGSMDLTLYQATIDSSPEVSVGHDAITGSASGLFCRSDVATVGSPSDYGSPEKATKGPLATLAASIPQGKSRVSSISRAYSATLSRLTNSSSKRVIASSKPSERSTMTMSKVMSSRSLNPRKRQKLPDFTLLHCERKVFDDGVVVQMIRSAVPPHRTPAGRPEDRTKMTSFPTVETHHLDVDTNLDESSFGLNRSPTTVTLQIQVHSPSLEVEFPDIPIPFDGSLQTIYHSMDEMTLSGDRPTVVGNLIISPLLSPLETTSHVTLTRTGGPRLSVSLMPILTPIILSELANLGEPEPSTSMPVEQTPATPSLSPIVRSCVSLSQEPSPVSTGLNSPQELDVLDAMDRTSASIQAVSDICFDFSVEEGGELTLLNLDLGDASVDSIPRSASGNELYGKDHRVSISLQTKWNHLLTILSSTLHWAAVAPAPFQWDSLYPESTSAPDVQPKGQAAQKRSISSSSVLAPLTEADFEASFEEVFCVGLVGNRAIQEGDQGPSPRTSVTSPGIF